MVTKLTVEWKKWTTVKVKWPAVTSTVDEEPFDLPVATISSSTVEKMVVSKEVEINGVRATQVFYDEVIDRVGWSPSITKNGWSHNFIKEFGKFKFYLDNDNFKIYVTTDGVLFKVVDSADIEAIKEYVSKVDKVIIEIEQSSASNEDFNPWDRILLYWPTGTGKTHQVIQRVRESKILFDLVSVSDWFEDIDFLTYIVPTKNGIQYKEKSIIGLLRRAAAWEKVAILIDEVNRWSKSFMNMVLKLLDPVTGMYEVNNFVADEVIRIPITNIIWFCTANLWGAYSGINDIDEALLDRFNRISFVDYNKKFEAELLKTFEGNASKVKTIVDYIRDLFKSNELKRPISSRSLKSRAEEFLMTKKTDKDIFPSFERTIMYRICGVDWFGFPSEQDIGVITSKFIELWLLSK